MIDEKKKSPRRRVGKRNKRKTEKEVRVTK